MRIEIQWNSLFPLSMPYVTTLQYREIFWQNGSLLYGSDTAKQEFFMRLQLRLQSLHKHDFISIKLLFYCWLTQQQFNFSVSFSFKQCLYDYFSVSLFLVGAPRLKQCLTWWWLTPANREWWTMVSCGAPTRAGRKHSRATTERYSCYPMSAISNNLPHRKMAATATTCTILCASPAVFNIMWQQVHHYCMLL